VTQPGRPIDTAFVDIEPDLRDFARELRAGMDAVLGQVERQVDQTTREIEEEFREAGRATAVSFEATENAVTRSLETIADEAADAGRALAVDISAGAEVAERAVDDFADAAERDLRRVQRETNETARSMGTAFREGTRGVFETLNQLRQNLLGLGTVLPSPLIAFILALTPAILGLGGALADLIGLVGVLPAGLGFLLATVAPLILAFQGLGEAIEAVLSNDPEKIREAFAGLAPEARDFVREIQRLVKPLGELQNAVQNAFFRPLSGVLTTLVKSALPTLQTGLTSVATALGRVFASLGEMLAQPDILEAIGDVFESTARIITQLGPGVIDLLGTLIGIMEHGLPFLEQLMGGFLEGIQDFVKLMSDGMKGEGFKEFVGDAIATLKELGGLTKSVFGLLVALLGPLDDAGRDLIGTLSDIIDRFTEWLGTAEGMRFIEDLIVAIELTGRALGYLINAIIFLIEFAHDVEDFLVGAVRWFRDAGAAVGDFFGMLGDWVGRAVAWFQMLPGLIMSAIKALPGMILGFFTFLFDTVTTAIGIAIGRWLKFFIDLPGVIMEALHRLPGVLFALWESIRSTVVSIVSGLWNRVVALFTESPGRIGSALSGLWPRLQLFFAQLGTNMYNAGRSLIQGLINGIVSMVTTAIDWGRRAAENIISGIRRGLGIASPSKVAAEQIGRPIVQGIGVGMEQERDAARRTLDDLLGGFTMDARGAGATTNTIHVTVNFVGGNPSQADAFRAGQAVGQGIQTTLANRDVRTRVRTT